MIVFRNYFKIVRGHLKAIIMYALIFILLVVFSNKSGNDGSNYIKARADIYIEDLDNSDLSRAFIDHLGRENNILDLEGKNILHCADSCYKFRGDYLYSIGRYDKMKFHFVGKGIADFDKYTKGYRVDPETGEYFLMGEKSSDAKVYKKFMDTV